MGHYIDGTLARLEGLRVIKTHVVERGRAYVTGDRTVFIGTGLCKGVPYRILGEGWYEHDVMRVFHTVVFDRVYVLVDNGKVADVIDAATGQRWIIRYHTANEVN